MRPYFGAYRIDERLTASGWYDVRAGFGQAEGDRTSDSRRAANHYGDAAGQR